MGFLGKLIQTGLDVALLPVAVAKDVVKLPVTALEPRKSMVASTTKRLGKLSEHAEELYEDIGDL